jgi:putative copper resistance protein D
VIDAIPAIRTVHFASSLFPAGALVFLLCVARPAFRMSGAAATPEEIGRFRRRLLRYARWSLIAALVSGLLWFIAQAAAMSGRPLAAAFDVEILGTVWRRTLFGRVWTVRLFLALIPGGLLCLRPPTAKDAGRPGIDGAAAFLTAAFAATLAWAGHASATRGTPGVLHLAADVVHLVATGAWLGGLVPLAILVEAARRGDRPIWTGAARKAAWSFSSLALCCVGTLVVTGMVNSWLLVGSVPALLGTPYGRTLLLKIALFLAAIVIGSVIAFGCCRG